MQNFKNCSNYLVLFDSVNLTNFSLTWRNDCAINLCGVHQFHMIKTLYLFIDIRLPLVLKNICIRTYSQNSRPKVLSLSHNMRDVQDSKNMTTWKLQKTLERATTLHTVYKIWNHQISLFKNPQKKCSIEICKSISKIMWNWFDILQHVNKLDCFNWKLLTSRIERKWKDKNEWTCQSQSL